MLLQSVSDVLAKDYFGGNVGISYKVRLSILVVFTLFLLVSGGLAQTNEGQLAGNVVDQTGAVIAGATVTARNEATGTTYSAVSTSAGNYRFPSIQLGRYTVTANAQSFKQAIDTGVEVQVNSTTSINLTLTTGSSSETVTVSADTPTVQTESSELGGVVTSRQIIELPLALGGVGALRSPEAFVFLIPGTTGPGSGNSNNGIFISKVAGGQNFANEILVDGASQTRSENGSSFDEEGPSVEALSEFKVTTSTPAAEFGRTTGGIENFVTKAGTNNYHGTIFELFQNDALNANSWFNNGFLAACASADTVCRGANARPADKKNDYGGSLGGPLSIPHLYNGRNRTFGFFSWEQFKQTVGGNVTSTLPTAAERGGDFSALLSTGTGIDPCTGTAPLLNAIYDPAAPTHPVQVTDPTTNATTTITCRTPFPGNIIPAARISKAGAAIAAFIPTPNLSGLTNNFRFSGSRPINDTTYSFRVDHSFSDSLKFFASYSKRENDLITGGDRALPAPVDRNTWTQDFLTDFARIGVDYTISPTLLNHFNFGFNRSNSINHNVSAAGTVNYSAQFGIGNIKAFAFPVTTFDGLDQYSQLANNQNNDAVDNGWRFNDSINWIRGRNSFKFGGDFRYQQFSAIHDTTPTLGFSRNETTETNQGGSTGSSGNSLASLLIGSPDSASQNVPVHQPQWRSTYFAVFAQDDFKVNNQLTLNLGFRYDVDFPRHEAKNNTSNFSPTATDSIVTNGITGTHPGALVFGRPGGKDTWANTWLKDFSPRIGFAYSPANSNGTTSLRGGYAILYGPLQYADFGGSMQTGFTANPSPVSLDHFSPAFQLDSGFPAFPPPPNLDSGQLNGQFIGGEYISPSMGRPAMIQSWSLQVQQQVAKDLIVTIGYVGQRGTHLRSSLENINNSPPSSFALGDALNDDSAKDGIASPYTGFTGQVQQALRPFPQYSFIASDCCLQNIGQSSYEALLTSVERRFSDGLNLQASYTWAKNITDADSILPGLNPGVSQFQNSFNHGMEKSISAQDIPHTFVISYIYELPFGKGKQFLSDSRWLDLAVGGWKIGGVQRYQSGEPISFGCANGIPGQDNCIRYNLTGSDLATTTYRGGTKINPFSSNNRIFNKLAFIDNNAESAQQTLNAGDPLLRTARGGVFAFGNAPRVTGAVRNFKYLNEDFSLLKDFHFTESAFFEFKVEALDAFNRHAFGIPDTQPRDGNFGIPTYTFNGPRTLQITGRISF